jgi:hypothetical protein
MDAVFDSYNLYGMRAADTVLLCRRSNEGLSSYRRGVAVDPPEPESTVPSPLPTGNSA